MRTRAQYFSYIKLIFATKMRFIFKKSECIKAENAKKQRMQIVRVCERQNLTYKVPHTNGHIGAKIRLSGMPLRDPAVAISAALRHGCFREKLRFFVRRVASSP